MTDEPVCTQVTERQLNGASLLQRLTTFYNVGRFLSCHYWSERLNMLFSVVER